MCISAGVSRLSARCLSLYYISRILVVIAVVIALLCSALLDRKSECGVAAHLKSHQHTYSKMHSIYFLLACLASNSLAAPSATISERGIYSWSAPLARFYQEVDKRIQEARQSPDFPNPPACDMSKASMPVAPTPLPGPDPATYLSHVAIGRGIQVSPCRLVSSFTRLTHYRTTPAQTRLRYLHQLAPLRPFTMPLAQKATIPRSQP